jgi:hypothetical protein
VDQWLLSKDFCPYCRTTLYQEWLSYFTISWATIAAEQGSGVQWNSYTKSFQRLQLVEAELSIKHDQSTIAVSIEKHPIERSIVPLLDDACR